MDSITLFRERIGASLTARLANAIGEQAISIPEAQEASRYILDHIDSATSSEALISFLEELSAKWPLFAPVLIMERGQINVADEKNEIKKIEEMLRTGDMSSTPADNSEETEDHAEGGAN